jgi:DnaJ-class molecular chaperone
MATKTEKQIAKIICDECHGNGYVRIPYHMAKEELWANCDKCESQGEIKIKTPDDLREKGM